MIPTLRYPDLLSQPSRFARWPAWLSGLVLAAFLALFAWGAIAPPTAVEMADRPAQGIKGFDAAPDKAGDDVLLYRAMAKGVREGGNYYEVAAPLLRDNNYPLRPFVTFRLPTLTLFLAHVPEPAALALMCLLVGAVIMAWTVRLAPALRTPEICSYASLFIMMNSLTAFSPALIVFHEGWAALLIALSLALYRKDRWWPSLLLALLAVMIRELALSYILLMGMLALINRNWREGLGWGAVTLLFAGALWLHAHQVWAVTSAADPASPGWNAGGGWRFVAAAIQKSTMISLAPAPVAQWLLPFALLGWAAWNGPTGLRTFLYIAGFATAMMLFGRPDNFYWAVMITPVLFVGLLFAPAALRDLVMSIRGKTVHPS